MADNTRERAPAVTLHLVPEDVWLAQKEKSRYQPEGFSGEGFIHCTHGHDFVIEVGNRYYRDDLRPYLVLEIDLERVAAPVVYEDDARRFPHIYGPLECHAVRRVYRVARAADGTFIAIGDPAPEHPSKRGHGMGIGLAMIIRLRGTGSGDRHDHGLEGPRDEESACHPGSRA